MSGEPSGTGSNLKEQLSKAADSAVGGLESAKTNTSTAFQTVGEYSGRFYGYAKDSIASAYDTTKTEASKAYNYLTSGWTKPAENPTSTTPAEEPK